MKVEDKPRFVGLILDLAENLGAAGPKRDEGGSAHQDRVGRMLDFYWRALEDMPLADVEEACAHAARTEEFMPKPAWFRKRSGIDERKESYHFPMPE